MLSRDCTWKWVRRENDQFPCTDSCLRTVVKAYPTKLSLPLDSNVTTHKLWIQVRKVFNDILSFRVPCNGYTELVALVSPQFRLVDMKQGKARDDGNRGVHLCYQKSNSCYLTEMQFNTLDGRRINNWLHDHLYKKYYPIETR